MFLLPLQSKERNPVGELGQGSNSDEVRDKVTETQSLGTDPSRGENEDRPVPESAEQEDTKTSSGTQFGGEQSVCSVMQPY